MVLILNLKVYFKLILKKNYILQLIQKMILQYLDPNTMYTSNIDKIIK